MNDLFDAKIIGLTHRSYERSSKQMARHLERTALPVVRNNPYDAKSITWRCIVNTVSLSLAKH